MSERFYRQWTVAMAIPIVCLVLLAQGIGTGQESGGQEAEKPAAAKKLSGRLPAYFSAVVTTEQRKQIYDVQASYQGKIEALQKQITDLLRQQDKDVDAVLKPDQLADVNRKRADAAAKRKARQAQPEPAVASDGPTRP